MSITLIEDGHTLVADCLGMRVVFRQRNSADYRTAKAFEGPGDANALTNKMLSESIIEWDAIKASGEAAPVTHENVAKLPAGPYMRLIDLVFGFTQAGVIHPEGDADEGNSKAASGS